MFLERAFRRTAVAIPITVGGGIRVEPLVAAAVRIDNSTGARAFNSSSTDFHCNSFRPHTDDDRRTDEDGYT